LHAVSGGPSTASRSSIRTKRSRRQVSARVSHIFVDASENPACEYRRRYLTGAILRCVLEPAESATVALAQGGANSHAPSIRHSVKNDAPDGVPTYQGAHGGGVVFQWMDRGDFGPQHASVGEGEQGGNFTFTYRR